MILLDTCSLIWLASDPTQFSAPARLAVEDPAQVFLVSAISAFEIGILVKKRKLDLMAAPDVWFAEATARYAVQVLDLPWRVALRSTHLPDIHNDPADRIIVATALERQCAILTPDPKIAAYPGVTVVW